MSGWSAVTRDVADEDRFHFVADVALRDIVARDYEEAELVYAAGAWKATAILCGAVIEGVLIDAVCNGQASAKPQRSRDSLGQDPARWKLARLVTVASELGIIRATTGSLSDTVRAFRNLVHPARQIREGLDVSKELANVARSAVEYLLAELRSSNRASRSASNE